MDLGKKIISLREKRGWTQRELANRVNLNVSVMNRIESNERPVKDSELLNLANILEVSTDYLLGRTDIPALTPQEKDEAAFQAFANDPELNVFYRELPESDEEAVRKLRNIWEIIKNEKK
ncbi:helix-turn-helix domain-containing protein [Lysinibacillus pakistanensis]|uniref:Helix-turn-helix transcriptional regulator n=1 Tax=Lysinibacillus pakistanensis TaxID=759811 RepID=A0AAX3X4Q0_9BACI|nr:helix-turn-helix transcriptional regulator [Lysinibacillus pakistanensis]MDM5233345.1 helix-turn-helix transcriptional regulator [Lysinibacillus pakistanensis]WHY48819.1 helix-turn-helix transcriptional regulator [Lysinibacillus pakistanensis]WHY53831.1 helix-turn-helix transcriptional regulator [Lysinibacillus pakistanensis]